jgi:hypothetical protein
MGTLQTLCLQSENTCCKTRKNIPLTKTTAAENICACSIPKPTKHTAILQMKNKKNESEFTLKQPLATVAPGTRTEAS